MIIESEDAPSRHETYVLGEIEVTKTGRKAEKPVSGGKQKMVLVEVTPANPDSDGTWKKWVNPSNLFQILPSEES